MTSTSMRAASEVTGSPSHTVESPGSAEGHVSEEASGVGKDATEATQMFIRWASVRRWLLHSLSRIPAETKIQEGRRMEFQGGGLVGRTKAGRGLAINSFSWMLAYE